MAQYLYEVDNAQKEGDECCGNSEVTICAKNPIDENFVIKIQLMYTLEKGPINAIQ